MQTNRIPADCDRVDPPEIWANSTINHESVFSWHFNVPPASESSVKEALASELYGDRAHGAGVPQALELTRLGHEPSGCRLQIDQHG